MDDPRSNENRPINSRRKPRSKMQIFKEAYLPVVIAAAAVVLIIIFIIGSITRAVEKKNAEIQASINASSSEAAYKAQLEAEASKLLTEAASFASQYDYQGAIDHLNSFRGTVEDYPALSAKRTEYETALSKMVAWDDPNDVLNLSFQLLVAEADRTFNHPTYATLFNRNFITTGEFSQMLLQLYENGYILVRMDDFIETQTTAEGTPSYSAKTLYLPEGKKPLMLTQTNVNYNIYLIDSDGDKFADKNGGGFATRMILDENGEITCEMIDNSGQTVTGNFDLVPILNDFVETHPDFSYKGAKATLALTGYNGLFGYRTNADAKDYFGVDAYNQAIEGATEIAAALQADGYEFACYTYENIGYGEKGVSEIEADLAAWQNEVVPILGAVDTLVFAQNSDIDSGISTYSGDKATLLKKYGFTKFIGFCNNGTTWASLNGDYLRQGRLMVTGSTVAHKKEWFTGIFDAASILDQTRGNVPA